MRLAPVAVSETLSAAAQRLQTAASKPPSKSRRWLLLTTGITPKIGPPLAAA